MSIVEKEILAQPNITNEQLLRLIGSAKDEDYLEEGEYLEQSGIDEEIGNYQPRFEYLDQQRRINRAKAELLIKYFDPSCFATQTDSELSEMLQHYESADYKDWRDGGMASILCKELASRKSRKGVNSLISEISRPIKLGEGKI